MQNNLKKYLADLPEHYIDAFRLLFTYENKLRVFVYTILKGNIGEAWQSVPIKEERSISSTFRNKKAQQKQYGHIGGQSNNPVDYLTLDDLIMLITNNSLARYFAIYFPASIEKVFAPKMWEVLITRNRISHFKDLKEEDVERLSGNVLEILKIIDLAIQEFTSMYWPDNLFDPEQNDPDTAIRKEWLPVFMKKKKIILKIVETPSKKWTKIFLLFPYLIIKDNDEIGQPILESFRIKFNEILGELKDLIGAAAYFNKLDVGLDEVDYGEKVQNEKEHYRVRGLEICFESGKFKNIESIAIPLLLSFIDELENEYSRLETTKNEGTYQDRVKYFIRETDYVNISDISWKIKSELKKTDLIEDWTELLEGPAFESFKKEESYLGTSDT